MEIQYIGCIQPNKTVDGRFNFPGQPEGFEMKVVFGKSNWGGPRGLDKRTPDGNFKFFWFEPWDEESEETNKMFFGEERGLYWKVPVDRECVEYTGEPNDYKFPLELLNITIPFVYRRVEKYYNIKEGMPFTENWQPVFSHYVRKEVNKEDVERILMESELTKLENKKLAKEIDIFKKAKDYDTYLERAKKDIGLIAIKNQIDELEKRMSI